MKKRAHNFKDLTGKIFNQLTVLNFDKVKNNRAMWKCLCICGEIKFVIGKYLINGDTKSCGCRKFELFMQTNSSLTHGMSKTIFYKVWRGMKTRCLDIHNKDYSHYGGRGIKVCDRWMKFENFRDDMYESYLQHKKINLSTSIDRIEVMGNYEPSNCRWATNLEQNRNRSISIISPEYEKHKKWRSRLSSLLGGLLKQNCKKSAIMEPYLGCSLLFFRKYLESLFLPGMTWDNWSNGKNKWNLDHIIGCNNFDLSKEKDRKKCFNYTNFQPLWYKDHMTKSKVRKSK